MNGSTSSGLRILMTALLTLAGASISAAAGAEGMAIPNTPLSQYRIADETGRTITYYTNHPAKPAPVLLMIQGSGCGMVMHVSDRGTYSTLYNLMPYAGQNRFKVVAVEKPFADSEANGGSADKCPAAFREDFTAESWLAALRTVLDDALRQDDADPSRIIALGTSEGAVMASLLAGRDRRVTHVIAISGSGTTQLLDFAVNAYERCFDRTACIEALEAQLRAIRSDPQSSTKLAWGHPYKRWTSFFAVDPSAELISSKARAYIAFGTQDQSVPALSTDFGIARLLLAGKDVTIRRMAEVGHGLVPPGGSSLSVLDRELDNALQWAMAAPAGRTP